MKLVHDTLYVLLLDNLVLRNEHMIHRIVDNMRNIEEADENRIWLSQIGLESQQMVVVYNGIHEEHNGLSHRTIGGILGQDAQLLTLVVTIANIADSLILRILLRDIEGECGKTVYRRESRRNLFGREVAKRIRIIATEFQNLQKGLATPVNILNITKVHSTSL